MATETPEDRLRRDARELSKGSDTRICRCVPCFTGDHAGCNRRRGALCGCALTGHDGTDPIYGKSDQ